MKHCSICGIKIDFSNKSFLCGYHRRGLGNETNGNHAFVSRSKGVGWARAVYYHDLQSRNPRRFAEIMELIGGL